ncbi:hypothetical protein W97_02201 [Coniosporium apollinis CBS 100218]|uniref:Uncharacterized protein n=1 Tax=Coniosporium apollinis (strain CBS 100218) TaxID=1168221 RepID=R7YM39_CONA1|nr:uncharacterized protein W97_02201 [Coniosporium apollinis CBS 100218]EON62975.1 hypothetical protein W97_02201 [Coniosporium apollinis CBS 100218]
MFRRTLFRIRSSQPTSSLRPHLRHGARNTSSKPPSTRPTDPAADILESQSLNAAKPEPSKAHSRLDRTVSRTPRFLRSYLEKLRSAPLTHITAFLLLHELTAVVPLIGLAATFHYTRWLPPYISEGAWVQAGVEKFGRYFRRKGWLGEEGSRREGYWGFGEGGVRWVVEVATAWAVVKALLPLRLAVSVSATPWFARWAVVPVREGVRRMVGLGRRKGVVGTAAGTGATSAGVVPKKGSVGGGKNAG